MDSKEPTLRVELLPEGTVTESAISDEAIEKSIVKESSIAKTFLCININPPNFVSFT